MTDGSEQAPAGWYDDPHSPGRMRYFDGQGWTNHFHEPGKLPSIGNWLNATFSVFGSHWQGAAILAFGLTFIGNLAIWVGLRAVVSNVAVANDELINFEAGTLVGVVLIVVFGFLWQGFGWLAMTRYLYRAHFQDRPTVADSLGHAVSRLPKYLLVVCTLVLFVVVIVFVLVTITVLAPALGVLLLLIGFFVAIWAAVKVAFLVTAIALAPPGTPVLRASADVSAGRFWAVFGRLVLLTLGLALVTNIITASLGSVGQVVDAEMLSSTVQVRDDTLVVEDFRFTDLLPTTNKLMVFVLINSVLQGASSLISTSATVRLYLDSGAPSET